MTKRTTVSMPEVVYEVAEQRMRHYGYSQFSDYIQALIRADSGVQPGGRGADSSSSHGEETAGTERKIVGAVKAEADRIRASKEKRPRSS